MSQKEEVMNQDSVIDTPESNERASKSENKVAEFLKAKKKEMKESQYRVRFDGLVAEVKSNLVNTSVVYGQKMYEKSGYGSMTFMNKRADGTYDVNVYPMKMTDRDQSRSGVPNAPEPIAFSKIMIATSVLAGKLPDGDVIADSKIYARASYELWKRTWSMVQGNGANTLMLVYQDMFTYGWGAWRVYPRRVSVKRKGVDKILFDDIYREHMDVERTWLGTGFNHGDYWSWGEVYYEKDIPKEDFFRMNPNAKNPENIDKIKYCAVSTESTDSNPDKKKTHVTLSYYENELANRYIIACGDYIVYDGELPNDGSHGSVVTARCFVRDINDPHGVGLYEMMRGNTALYTYLNSLNAQQVEAEIYPILFGTPSQNGTGQYKRGPNVVNPKQPGSSIDVVRTTGNVSQGIAFADKQKISIEENTGVNNIVSGADSASTLGSTVILKEAAYNRLTPPKNSMVTALEKDAHIAHTWIMQTYTVDKVFMLDSNDQLSEFVKQNPDYFVETQQVVNDMGIPTGKFAAVASRNLRLNFDFTEDGKIMENVPTRQISAKGLMSSLKDKGHISDYIEFIIDPNSMLLPSLEIKKQTFAALFPVITNQITLIYSLRNKDPEAAASQLLALEQLLDINGMDIYDYVQKSDYDAIINKVPSEMQLKMREHEMLMNAKDSAIQAMAGGAANGSMGGEEMTEDGTDPLQPQNPEEVPRPQSPLGSSIDASVGRAGSYQG